MSDQSDIASLSDEALALVVADALVGVDFSVEDWVDLLENNAGFFSTRNALINEAAGRSPDWLASVVLDEDEWADRGGEGNFALAQQFAALPPLQKIAVFDIVSRFNSGRAVRGGMRAMLESLGVVFADTAHAKLRAAAARASWR